MVYLHTVCSLLVLPLSSLLQVQQVLQSVVWFLYHQLLCSRLHPNLGVEGKITKEEANKIAAAVVKKEIEKNTCQNIACRHLKSKHLGDKRQCMVVTCTCSEFVKKR